MKGIFFSILNRVWIEEMIFSQQNLKLCCKGKARDLGFWTVWILVYGDRDEQTESTVSFHILFAMLEAEN